MDNNLTCANCGQKSLVHGEYWMSHRPYGYTTGYQCQSCKCHWEHDDPEVRNTYQNQMEIKRLLKVKNG